MCVRRDRRRDLRRVHIAAKCPDFTRRQHRFRIKRRGRHSAHSTRIGRRWRNKRHTARRNDLSNLTSHRVEIGLTRGLKPFQWDRWQGGRRRSGPETERARGRWHHRDAVVRRRSPAWHPQRSKGRHGRDEASWRTNRRREIHARRWRSLALWTLLAAAARHWNSRHARAPAAGERSSWRN